MKKQSITSKIIKDIVNYPGASNTGIAKRIKASPATVSSTTNRLFKSGKLKRISVEKKSKGIWIFTAWYYFLPNYNITKRLVNNDYWIVEYHIVRESL